MYNINALCIEICMHFKIKMGFSFNETNNICLETILKMQLSDKQLITGMCFGDALDLHLLL